MSARLALAPRIRDEPFPKGFSLPRDTPKYNGSVKPEDWLIDYSTAVSIANGNRRVAVKYVPLMLQGMARTWLNSLKPRSINSWLDFTEAFIHNFTSTYKRAPKPRQLSLCVQGPLAINSRVGPSSATPVKGCTRCKP